MNDQKAHVEIQFASHTYTATVREPSKLSEFLAQQSEGYKIISVDYIDADSSFKKEIKGIIALERLHFLVGRYGVQFAKPALKTYLKSHTRDSFADAKRAAVKLQQQAFRKWQKENYDQWVREGRQKPHYEAQGITTYVWSDIDTIDHDRHRHYDDSFPTRKEIIGIIEDVLDDIRKSGKEAYGFTVEVESPIYTYSSLRDKLEGYEADCVGEYSEPVVLAELTKQDVEIQLGL